MKKLVFCFLIIPIILFAQEPPFEDPEKQQYYVIVEEALPEFPILNSTATKLPELSLWTPASVGVVSSALFRQQDAVVLGDALKNVSGVNVQTGFGAFDFFTIRGFDSLNSGLVLTDGAPEPEVTFYQLYNVERVEVLKGPGAFLYGGNPLSGTVNLIRKQPLFENLFQGGTSFGHFGTFRANVDANYGTTGGDWAFRVNGYWQSSNRFRDEKDNYDVAVNPAITWRINDDSDLRINFEYLHNKYQPDSGIPVAGDSILDVPRERSYQSPFDRSEQDIFRARLDYQKKFNEWFTFRNKFYDTVLDWLSQGTLVAGSVPNGFGDFLVIRTLPVLDDRQHVVGNQAEGIFTFKTGTITHKFLAGFELNRLADDFTLDVALLPPIAAFEPFETATEPLFF
ncbi:MAG TPA: TonB-dependent receptor plug domain-containing protein, partial [Acidobacteriota bacterium]